MQSGAHGAQMPTRVTAGARPVGRTGLVRGAGGMRAPTSRAPWPFRTPGRCGPPVQGCPLGPFQASSPRGVHAGAAPPTDATRASPKCHKEQRVGSSPHISLNHRTEKDTCTPGPQQHCSQKSRGGSHLSVHPWGIG